MRPPGCSHLARPSHFKERMCARRAEGGMRRAEVGRTQRGEEPSGRPANPPPAHLSRQPGTPLVPTSERSSSAPSGALSAARRGLAALARGSRGGGGAVALPDRRADAAVASASGLWAFVLDLAAGTSAPVSGLCAANGGQRSRARARMPSRNVRSAASARRGGWFLSVIFVAAIGIARPPLPESLGRLQRTSPTAAAPPPGLCREVTDIPSPTAPHHRSLLGRIQWARRARQSRRAVLRCIRSSSTVTE